MKDSTAKPTDMVNNLKSKIKENEEEKEKLKSIIKEQEDLIKQQHAVIQQYEKEIDCLKSINKSILHTPISLARYY